MNDMMNLMRKYWWAIALLVLVLFPTKSKKRYLKRYKRRPYLRRSKRKPSGARFGRRSKSTYRKFSKSSRGPKRY